MFVIRLIVKNFMRFYSPCVHIMKVSSTYVNRNFDLSSHLSIAAVSMSSMNRFAITGDSGVFIDTPLT